ncbi:MAG TPA: GAF domain-containing sensor histidine kinase [Dictyobacter sp.]|jgi:two-component system NarL family sensor kinase|nr:GAF domain-containing sensor histidine kinase [Dictyobacter sp.]
MQEDHTHEPITKQPSAPLLHGNRDLAVLYAIAGYLNRQVEVHEVLQEVLARVTELLGLRAGWVWLFDEQDHHQPRLAAARNLPPYLADYPERMTGGCLCVDTFTLGAQEHASNIDVLRCSRLRKAELNSDPTAQGLRFHSSVPIFVGDTLLGIMNVASEDWRELKSEELQLLHIISDQIGLALQRARLSAEHTHAATRLATIEERNRLAREIHDTLAQGLAAITLQLETADTLLETRPERAQDAIQRALKLARGNLEEARRSVMDLRAAPLENHTLTEALATLASIEAQPPVQFTCVPAHQFPALPPRIEAGIYRIAQEALTNAHRHAQASTITMKLQIEGNRIHFTLLDDGRGFDVEQIASTHITNANHFGLKGMGERVKLLGGSISISSETGVGTHIEVSLPY